jgi:hypothetical protein
MMRSVCGLFALSFALSVSAPAEARMIRTSIDMKTFVQRCAAAQGRLDAEPSGVLCALPSGAEVACMPEASGLSCDILVERRGRGLRAADIVAMQDGSLPHALYALTQ